MVTRPKIGRENFWRLFQTFAKEKDMKAFTYIFYSAVAGVGVCLVMTIVTAVHQHQVKKAVESAPLTIPLPAEAPHS